MFWPSSYLVWSGKPMTVRPCGTADQARPRVDYGSLTGETRRPKRELRDKGQGKQCRGQRAIERGRATSFSSSPTARACTARPLGASAAEGLHRQSDTRAGRDLGLFLRSLLREPLRVGAITPGSRRFLAASLAQLGPRNGANRHQRVSRSAQNVRITRATVYANEKSFWSRHYCRAACKHWSPVGGGD